MQRRRRKKAEPKNIFGTGSQSAPSSKSTKARRPPTTRQTPHREPPSLPGSKPKPVTKTPQPVVVEQKPVVENLEVVSEETEEEPMVVETQEKEPEEIEESLVEELSEDQNISSKKRKDLGLSKPEIESPEEPLEDDGKSLKARQIIQNSMLKASKAIENAETKRVKKSVEPKTAETKEIPKKPQRKFRNKVSSYQPASRAKRLDRSRHMEYKYEMRGLLVDIGVTEEHRSNLLATIWARGERQTTKEAKQFLDEKLSEGVIDEGQLKSLERIVDVYTIRR